MYHRTYNKFYRAYPNSFTTEYLSLKDLEYKKHGFYNNHTSLYRATRKSTFIPLQKKIYIIIKRWSPSSSQQQVNYSLVQQLRHLPYNADLCCFGFDPVKDFTGCVIGVCPRKCRKAPRARLLYATATVFLYKLSSLNPRMRDCISERSRHFELFHSAKIMKNMPFPGGGVLDNAMHETEYKAC